MFKAFLYICLLSAVLGCKDSTENNDLLERVAVLERHAAQAVPTAKVLKFVSQKTVAEDEFNPELLIEIVVEGMEPLLPIAYLEFLYEVTYDNNVLIENEVQIRLINGKGQGEINLLLPEFGMDETKFDVSYRPIAWWPAGEFELY